MAEFRKHVGDSLYAIRHALRELPPGKTHSNEDIDPSLTPQNYSLLHGRCETATEANKYRKEIEKELFKYNRKGLVKSIEIVIQCPSDCTDEKAFFEESYKYVCEKVLPMGERAVFSAQVHRDEHKYLKDENGNYKLDDNGKKLDISKNHLHILAVPGVPDTKHEGFDYKLSAHDLTSKTRLRYFHPGLQRALDDAGIKATVYTKPEGSGKTIGLSVKQLKEITNATGIVIDKSLTVDKLAEILKENQEIKIVDQNLQKELQVKEEILASKDATISQLKEEITTLLSDKNIEIKNNENVLLDKENEIFSIKEQLKNKELEAANIKLQNIKLEEKINALEEELKQKEIELEKSQSKTIEKEVEASEWGSSDSWGSSSSWGSASKNYEEEKIW